MAQVAVGAMQHASQPQQTDPFSGVSGGDAGYAPPTPSQQVNQAPGTGAPGGIGADRSTSVANDPFAEDSFGNPFAQ